MGEQFNVTFLISTYNNVEHIEECLDSIENQSFFKNKQIKYQVLIGVDGCEGTYDKIVSIKNKYRNLDVYNMKKNMGAYVALNTLLPYVKYDNILIFGSDDVLLPNAIETLSNRVGDYDIIKFRFKVFVNNIMNVVSEPPSQAAGAILIHKRVFDLCGGYHENRFSSDYELLVRVGKFVKIQPIKDVIFYYRAHDKSLTTTVDKRVRMNFDNQIRRTNYNMDNVKITPVMNNVDEHFTTY